MKKRHSIHLLLAAAALLLATAACTKDEPTDGTRLPEGQYPLEIAAVTLSVEGGEAQPCARQRDRGRHGQRVRHGRPVRRADRRRHRDCHLHRAGQRHSHPQRTPLLERPRRSHRQCLVSRHGRHPRPLRLRQRPCLPAARHGHGRLPDPGRADLHPPVGKGARHALGCHRRQ